MITKQTNLTHADIAQKILTLQGMPYSVSQIEAIIRAVHGEGTKIEYTDEAYVFPLDLMGAIKAVCTSEPCFSNVELS